jgi:hypothetical protein
LSNFRTIDRETGFLLPPSVDDWLVDEGPIPTIHGVVSWRACDLTMRLHKV